MYRQNASRLQNSHCSLLKFNEWFEPPKAPPTTAARNEARNGWIFARLSRAWSSRVGAEAFQGLEATWLRKQATSFPKTPATVTNGQKKRDNLRRAQFTIKFFYALFATVSFVPNQTGDRQLVQSDSGLPLWRRLRIRKTLYGKLYKRRCFWM